MKMSIKTDRSAMDNLMRAMRANAAAMAEKKSLSTLVRAGEIFLSRARHNAQGDSPLLASIGYGVYKGGSLVHQGGFDGGNGTDILARATKSMKADDMRYTLVTVAADESAVYLESMGIPVAADAQMQAEAYLNKTTGR